MADLIVGDLTPRAQYTATSGQTAFTYAFPIFVDADLKVYIGSTLKTLTTDYTVSGAGTDNGGIVTLVTGATIGDIVTVYRDMPVQRTSDYQTNGDLLASTLNDDLDKLAMMIQQVEYDLNNRVLRFGQFTTGIPLSEFTESDTDRAGKVLGFDSLGNPNITQELGVYKGSDATTTTAAYVIRDIVKSTTTAQLNNIYICTAASPSGTALTNTSYWALLIDAVSAGSSATAAAASAAAALVSENNAQSSEDDAETAQVAAELAETHAETAETNAETAETAAVVAQTAAEAAQTSATASQASATASATSATASAASAASSASGASSSATDAQSSEDDAATSETNASNSATASASSATASAASATTATTQATTATTQATNASTSATTATTQAGIATTKAGEAATSATNAAASATTAAGYVPSATGHSGEYLTTDGTTNSWASVDALPDQTGNAGKYLTTDATTASWATISTDLVSDTTPQLGGTLDCNGNHIDFGNWTITETTGVLYFATGGVNKMKLDASGNLTVVGDVTASGTI